MMRRLHFHRILTSFVLMHLLAVCSFSAAQEPEPAAPADPFGPGVQEFQFDEGMQPGQFPGEFQQPQGPPEEAFAIFAGVMLVVVVIAVLFFLALYAVVCWLLSNALAAVPEQFREMSTGQVWLLMIPCFNIIWSFFVSQRIPKSFQNYFSSVGVTKNGDCGAQIGLWWSISWACCLVPYL